MHLNYYGNLEFLLSLTCPIELLMSECGRELLFVSPGAGGNELWMEWCFITEEAVLLSSSSSSSDAEPKRESAN